MISRLTECSVSGLKWEVPTVLYVVSKHDFHKVGVANNETLRTRLRLHRRFGLELLAGFQFQTGHLAHDAEQSVITWWRDECGSSPVPREVLPDGWTETVSNSQIPPDGTLRYVLEILGHTPMTEQVIPTRC